MNLDKLERMSEKNWIRASEIGEYMYCRRSWWLKRVVGRESRNIVEMKHGEKFHLDHADKVDRTEWTRKIAYILIALALAVIVFSALNM